MTEIKTEFETTLNGETYYLAHNPEVNRTYLIKIDEAGEDIQEYSCLSNTPSWDVLYSEILRQYDEIILDNPVSPTNKDIIRMMNESFRMGKVTGREEREED